MATLSPATSPKTLRHKASTRTRASSHLPPYNSQESHDAALHSIRSFLKATTSYDAFPVSFRLIVLDTKLSVKKALQCLLVNGCYTSRAAILVFCPSHPFSRRRICAVVE